MARGALAGDVVIAAVFGTTGELIKLFPVLRALEARGTPALLVTTGQQAAQIPALLSEFGLPQPALWLGRGHRGGDLERMQNLPVWGATVARRALRHRAALRRRLDTDGRRPLVLVHGDTMTTVIGAGLGRTLGLPVAHVEAGLRSGSWHNPFPEELDRRATSRLATIHFAPGAWAAENLRAARVRGEIVDTGSNTIRDSLALMADASAPAAELPDGPWGLVSIHRQELLGRPRQLRAILALLREKATEMPLLFVEHPITMAAIEDAGLTDQLTGLRRIARRSYPAFVRLLERAAFLVTDSGGSQEECAALGIPCLVHRATTERLDGLDGGSVVLSEMDLDVVSAFLAAPEAWRREPWAPVESPTAAIVAALTARGHA